MSNNKKGIMDIKKSKINLKMDFDARDVIDILVSEQEQNIENQINNLGFNSQNIDGKLKISEKEIDAYITELVKNKYDDKFKSLEATFKEIDLNATVRFEIIDGRDMPGRRPILTSNPNPQYKDDYERIIVALVICNKSLDRSTVDNSVAFYLESEYDDELKRLNKEHEKMEKERQVIRDKLRELNERLEGTDRLVRRAKAAVTKKAVGQDVEALLSDFRKEFPQIALKDEEKK